MVIKINKFYDENDCTDVSNLDFFLVLTSDFKSLDHKLKNDIFLLFFQFLFVDYFQHLHPHFFRL